MDYLTPVERWMFIGVLAASAVWRVARCDAAATFFLLQAAVPWGATLAISAWGGRPLLQDRYLVMAQVALVAYLGVVFARCLGIRTPAPADDPAVAPETHGCGRMLGAARMRGSRLREHLGLAPALMWAWLWGSMCVYGCVVQLSSIPKYPPPIAVATVWLKDHYRPGDRVMTAPAPELNILLYYSARAGMSEIDARCPINVTPSRGQRSHVASLHAQDVVNVVAAVPIEVKRIWIVNQTPAPPVGWKQVLERTFRDGQPPNGGTVTLALYLRNGS